MTTQANRQGRPWQRKDGRWAARAYPPGGGKPKMVYGADETEVIARQHEIEAKITQAPADSGNSGVPQTAHVGAQDASSARPKTTRITVDLAAKDYAALWRSAGRTAAESGRRVSLADAIRTMIRKDQA